MFASVLRLLIFLFPEVKFQVQSPEVGTGKTARIPCKNPLAGRIRPPPASFTFPLRPRGRHTDRGRSGATCAKKRAASDRNRIGTARPRGRVRWAWTARVGRQTTSSRPRTTTTLALASLARREAWPRARKQARKPPASKRGEPVKLCR
jgi:hypothetical protein